MAFQGSVLVSLLLPLSIIFSNFEIGTSNHVLSRDSFPNDFVFGTASSAYQYEGAAREGGKGLSIWDTYTLKTPDKIANESNGNVAIDFYHRYKEDVKLMKYIGLDAFRFSISWSRLLPYGKLSGGINKEGVAFYNHLINELLANGLQPFVTLFHWDLPQALEDEYGGFLNSRIVDDFRDFAEVCYKEFGDRVKNWITLNEPLAYALLGYDLGAFAPGRCSSWRSPSCSAGDSATEPYIVGHNLILSHAAAFHIYKQKYQAYQKGQIGISLVSVWMVPSSNAKSDRDAVRRGLDFTFGWYMHPLTYGDYPKSMREIVGNRLPEFNDVEAKRVMGSFDFVGLNYYYSFSVSEAFSPNYMNLSYSTDGRVNQTFLHDEKLTQKGVSNTMYPEGLKDLLVYTKKKYGDPTIYITENGMADTFVATVEEGVNDFTRIYFYKRHLLSLRKAIEAGVKVKGFFAWSFLDNFEWTLGYNSRYGIGYVDYNDGLKRYLKRSALWFKTLLVGY